MDSAVPLFKIKAKNKGEKRKYSVYNFMFCKGCALLKILGPLQKAVLRKAKINYRRQILTTIVY